MCAEVDQCVKEALGHQSSDWHICHSCSACTYKLQGKKQLLFSMLWAMDGNDSLKHILHRMANPDTNEQDGPSQE
jgi:hypothetical protein